MRKPRILPSLPGLPGPSLPVIVLSFPAAWQSPGAGMAESGLLHPHHPPRVSGEAEAQECPVPPSHGQAAASTRDPGTTAPRGCSGCWGLLSWPPAPAAILMGSSAQSWEANPSPRRQRSRDPAAVLCRSPPARGPVAAVPLGGRGAPARAQLTQHWLHPRCYGTAASRLRRLCPLSPETQCPSLEVTWELPILCNSSGRGV